MLSLPFLRSRRFSRLIIAVGFFVLIATVTYLGFRPNLTEATNLSTTESANALTIPSLSLKTPVEEVQPQGRDLPVPDQIAAAYNSAENKTFIFGHSSTVFKDLKDIKIGAEIVYLGKTYIVNNITVQIKSNVSMDYLLAAAKTPTLVLMTCHGEQNKDNPKDSTHRLVITAEIAERISDELQR